MTGRTLRVAAGCAVGSARLGTAFFGGRRNSRDLTDRHLRET